MSFSKSLLRFRTAGLSRKSWDRVGLAVVVALGLTLAGGTSAFAQQSGTIEGIVKDPTGAVVPRASVEIHNPVSHYDQSTVTNAAGTFRFTNVPFNPYHLSVVAGQFAPYVGDVDVRSLVATNVTVTLSVAALSEVVNVSGEASDLVEVDPTAHTDVDRKLFTKLPLESQSSSLSSLVTLASPGIAADSNGLFHGMGDHASNSFSVDGQPITDQQSKVFSNQIPLDAVGALEVIPGAPTAEYGEKTSVVINVTTRSGLGLTPPDGNVFGSFGRYQTANAGFNYGAGNENFGNFVSLSGLNTNRFLDPPEIQTLHDRGNQQNVFDRADFKFSQADAVQVNLGYTRSSFQTPNTYDNIFHTDANGNLLPPTDQRSKIQTINAYPSWTRVLTNNSLFNLAGWARHDQYNYYPSPNPLADLSSLQGETVAQNRRLTNVGGQASYSYIKGVHNFKVGGELQQTSLTENDRLAIVDPNLLPSLADGNGDPCFDDTGALASPCTDLLPYDLTRGGGYYNFNRHANVRLGTLYAQDQITRGDWVFNVGLRGDSYHGLSKGNELEPRLGLAYKVEKTNTVLRASYARTMETPFNENLIISSVGCGDPVLNTLLGCADTSVEPLVPGKRNEYHLGFEQAFGTRAVLDFEYVWKYTTLAYDFSVLGNTPITFPVEWSKSKIPGYTGRLSIPDVHGFSALVVFSSVKARFFTPQLAGAGATPASVGAFRIDHDEKFNQTTHLQYQLPHNGPWLGFNWRYDSGLVAGAVPFAIDATTPVDLTGLTADQQMQAGLFCGSQKPTLGNPLTTCSPSQYGSTRISIPAPGTENDDHNPPRIRPRNLFDLAVGDDDIFGTGKNRVSLTLTVINLTNKVALYNFLSTFSGTHFVAPRTYTAQLGYHF
ncbi:MAG TPA: TonB-dependent receptor [Thermoanaerobaculia bacterium]|nr:TonB-dependent receptor [Thermoanaerobaculia bacterium]